jgi:hypothetical protein
LDAYGLQLILQSSNIRIPISVDFDALEAIKCRSAGEADKELCNRLRVLRGHREDLMG